MIKGDLKSTGKRGENLTDSERLKELIKSKGLMYKYVAKCLNLSYYGFMLKVNNVHEFTTGEITALCDLLGITSLKEKEQIFFAKKVI